MRFADLNLDPPLSQKTTSGIWFAYLVPLLVEAGGFGPLELGAGAMLYFPRREKSRFRRWLCDWILLVFPELYHIDDAWEICMECDKYKYRRCVIDLAEREAELDSANIPY